MSRAIDGDRLKRKAQEVATEAWKMKIKAKVEVILNEFIDWINDAPTIEPERKKGKWIDCDGSEHWKCDKCGCRAGYWFNEENSSSWELDMSEWLSNFCPNCGADMRGKGEK